MTTPAPAKRHPHSETMILVGRGVHRGSVVAIDESDGTTTLAELDTHYGMCLDTPPHIPNPICWLWTTREITHQDRTSDHTHPLPGAEVVIIRTRMIGGGLAYDAYVPLEQMHVPNDPPYPMMQIGRYNDATRSSRTFLSFADATMPRDVQRMKPDWDKYFACEAHRKTANKHLHRLACTVYPELRQLSEMPFLWIRGLVPKVDEAHAERTVSLAPLQKAA